ncbi:class II aldolase/adducin family protein [Anaerococcus rubeinfantis]|uniref:class II aldolase/adducin family protein n=1 Tax=Anaerococcus rubeinfantis TaxID=1720199 RepID=UPI00073F5EC6|nr:class II aldolase/adducin family protein [Anaerococcus rubeinfantis]
MKEKDLKDLIWVSKALFDRNKVSGSTANISFKDKDLIYVSKTGSCFGNMNEDSFSVLKNDKVISDNKPSKEYPMHKLLYDIDDKYKCVIHTHSTFITYWSCILESEDKTIDLKCKTPYLKIKVGDLGWVKYKDPGSQELFDELKKSIDKNIKAYVMENHGVIVVGESIEEAFYMIEEIEESAKNAFLLSLK